jgi:predicted metalloprotease with PDZ domain
MFALDLHIRRRTDGAKSLDDVLRHLWKRYGAVREPHPDNLQPVFEEATGVSLGDFFDRLIRGTQDPELAEDLAYMGLELRTSADPATATDSAGGTWLGVTCSGNKVSGVFDGSPAQLAGISPGDELIAIDGFRATSDGDLRNLLLARRIDDSVEVTLFRRHRLVRATVRLVHAPPTRYEFATVAEQAVGPGAAHFLQWIGEPYPGPAQVLATITTTARWV